MTTGSLAVSRHTPQSKSDAVVLSMHENYWDTHHGVAVCGEVGPATRQEVTVRTAERKGHVVLAEQRKAEDAAWAGLRQWDQSFP